LISDILYCPGRGRDGNIEIVATEARRRRDIVFIEFLHKNCGARYPPATNIYQNTAPPSPSSFPQV